MDILNVGIVCGCLPAQYGIDKPDLYHQLLSKKMVETLSKKLEIKSVWYTTIAQSAYHTRQLIDHEHLHLLIYHVRPDPYLRASKIVLIYDDIDGVRKYRINLDANDSMVFDKDINHRQTRPSISKLRLKWFFRYLNYLFGYLLGTCKNAVYKECQAIHEIVSYCSEKELNVIVVGPASRPRSEIENFLLKRLEKKIARCFFSLNYVNCFGKVGEDGKSIFMEDKVHLNKDGHIRMSDLIFKVLNDTINFNR